MSSSSDEEEEMDVRAPSCLATRLTTTRPPDDLTVHPAFKINRADRLRPLKTNTYTKMHVTLVNDTVWEEFYSIGTEMLLTRKGRRMFPACQYRITGMNPHLLYILIMDFHLMDEYRYRWTVAGRSRGGPSEVQHSRCRGYRHPSSPQQGAAWMESPVVFGAVKLTSDLLSDDALVLLHSNHRYIPRLHIVPFDPNRNNTVNLDSPEVQTFMFSETEFYAVSCYQNPKLIKLKIKHNPFARHFLEEEVQQPRKNIKITPPNALKFKVSSSSDAKLNKKWAKKRSSLPAAAEAGFGVSPVLKRKMNFSELSSRDNSFSLTGGLDCSEEMFSTDDEGSDSGKRPIKARVATPCLKKHLTANVKLKATTGTKASPRALTSTPRVMKRPVQILPKTLKMPLNKSSAEQSAKGSCAVVETPVEPAEEAPELAVDDVEGLLFVSFPSKESHDTHVPLKRQPPPTPPKPPSSPSPPPPKCPPVLQVQEPTMATEPEEVNAGPEVLQNSFAQLEKVLLLDLGTMKHRQVIHPALHRVGLKLNLVDPEVAIDLQYLGVSLPLPPFLQSSADGTIPFVSRTGKTNDITKIKGWRDKYSSSSDLPHAPPQEKAMKVSSAFSSSLLDEYLESEGQIITERAETFSSCGSTSAAAAPGGTGVAYSLPARGSSYVRTLDSVLKRQATASSTHGPSLSSTNTAHGSPTLTSFRPRGAAFSPTSMPGTSRSTLSPTAQPVPLYAHKHTPRPGVMSPVVPQMRISTSPIPRQPSSGKMQPKRLSNSVSPHIGLTTPQRHLQALEGHAFCRGHAHTCITAERATIALGVLLTAEGPTEVGRVNWTSEDVLGPCKKDFCRLGCICLSLEREPRGPTHCRRPQCMFECVCFRHRMLVLRPHPAGNANSSAQRGKKPCPIDEGLSIMAYPISDDKAVPRPAPGQRVRMLWDGRADAEDPDPLFSPQQKCLYEIRASLLALTSRPQHKGGGGRRAEEVQKDSPVYLYFESMMTCARVRPINSLPPPQVHLLPPRVSKKAMEKAKQSPDPPVSKLNTAPLQQSVPSQKSVPQKEMKTKEVQTIKMLEIVSECNWEPHKELVLGALQRRLKLNLLVPSFKLGYYQVKLLSTTQQNSENHITITYKLNISRNDGGGNDNASSVSEKLKPFKKPQPALPGYLKARKLGCGIPPKRLIEVNGKQYPKATLLLGRMGALQPANRLAAFLTGRHITLPQIELKAATPKTAPKKTVKALLNREGKSPTTKPRKTNEPKKKSEPRRSTGASAQTPNASVGQSGVSGPLAASQLLYIPIGTAIGGTPSGVPSATNPDPATQILLKPVANTQEGALYRQPNGQLVQLVPLQPLKTIMPKPASGAESDPSTPSGAENNGSSSSACQDGNRDANSSAAKPFSLSGKSSMCISQGSTAVRSLPGAGIFSFRICPPTETPEETLDPDSQKTQKDVQNPSQQTSSSVTLPGGFTLIQLPQVPSVEVKTPGTSVETKAGAASSQVSDKKLGSFHKLGPLTAGSSSLVAQIDKTAVKERKIIAPVVVPPAVFSNPFRNVSLKPSEQDSILRLASDRSHKTVQQGSGASLASDVSHRTSKQGSGASLTSEVSLRISQQGSGASLASDVSRRTSQQGSGPSLTNDVSFRISQHGSGASLASDVSHRTSQQGSGASLAPTPKAKEKPTGLDALRELYKGVPGRKALPALSSVHQRAVLDVAFRRLKEVLHMSNLKVTQQDILDQARLIISALQSREKSLEERKSIMSDTQSSYIKTISQLSGKTEEVIRKKLQETSKRQRLLEQYRQRKTDQVQLTPKECDWLTERFAIWKRHARKSRRKVLASPSHSATEEEPVVGTPKSSWHSDGKARDSPELRAALLTMGNNAAQGSSSGQQQSVPSLGLDVNKVLSLLKMKTLPPRENQSGEPIKLLCIPALKNVDKPSENTDHVSKGNCLDMNGSDDHSESLVEDAGNISPSGPVNTSSSQENDCTEPSEGSTEGGEKVLETEPEGEEQSSSDAALATETEEKQNVDEKTSADQTSPSEMSTKEAKKRSLPPPPVVENIAPKRKRGRPRKHATPADAAQPTAKTAPPVPQKVKQSARLQTRQLRRYSPVSTRTHQRRGKRRGRR